MASFPNAVVSFPTRNTGDVITAAFFNDPNAEIVAIEAGYLQGTAPLNSSNSTMVSLSVTGNSTIGGALSVTGNATIGGALSAAAQPYCILRNGAVQSVGTAAWTGLNFDTEDEDRGSLHSTSVNSSRITITSTGVYTLFASASFAANSSGTFRGIRFVKNDVTLIPGKQLLQPSTLGVPVIIALSLQHRFSTSGDYVTVQVIQDTGSNLNVGDSTNVDSMCMFSARREPL